MSALDMSGHVSGDLKTTTGVRTPYSQARIDGVSQVTPGAPASHDVNVQPLNPKEIQALGFGAERIKDIRKVWVNDGSLHSLTPSDTWQFPDEPTLSGTWKVIAADNRPWRNYCKLMVSRHDG